MTLMRNTPEIDWVCLCLISETAGFEGDPRLAEDVMKQGCPIVGIPSLGNDEMRYRLERAMRQTRPDVVLQAAVRDLDLIYPETKIPLVTVSHCPGESGLGCGRAGEFVPPRNQVYCRIQISGDGIRSRIPSACAGHSQRSRVAAVSRDACRHAGGGAAEAWDQLAADRRGISGEVVP